MAINPLTGAEESTQAVPALGQPAQPQIPTYQAPAYTPGSNFQFDPNQYLPGIQQQASQMYSGQAAQIEALAKINTQQSEQKKITTREEFAKELERRKEIINSRGAFFSPGAINQQNDILKRETSAITDIDLQEQVSQAGFLAQQAGLSAQQAEYIQEKLSGAQGSAYGMWKDQYGMYQDQERFNYQKQQDEQDRVVRQQQYDRSIFEADRDYNLKLKQIKADKSLSKSARKRAEKEANDAKAKFDAEMKYKYAALAKKGGSDDDTDAIQKALGLK